MTDIALRNGQQLDLAPTSDQAIERLAEWARVADAAYGIATKLAGTSFAPQAYRGKPEEATAAILAGAELGLGPMAALRAFDNIQGVPAPKAMTLRAIVQSKGHEVKVLESSPERAVVAGRAKGDDDWQTSTWTIERARQMGLLEKNPQYKKQPANMLVARATAEVCRWIASDAIMGMPYAAEELEDEPTVRPRPMRVTAAEILGEPTDEQVPLAVAATDDAIAAGASAPWEPGERETLITAANVIDEIRDAQTQVRLDELKALCQELGIRDQQVLDAWSARSAEIVEAA